MTLCTSRPAPVSTPSLTPRLLRHLLVTALLWSLLASGSVAGITAGDDDLGAIWFLGDSITQSNADGDSKGSPRQALHDLLVAKGYGFSYTGHSRSNREGLPKTQAEPIDNLYHYHSGVSGILIGEKNGDSGITPKLAEWWTQGRLEVVKPQVILIMIGTNDIGKSYDVPNAPRRLRTLLQTIYAQPEVGNPTVFLASIPPNGRGAKPAAGVAAFNASVPKIVAHFKKKGRDIHFVDQFTALNADYAANMRKDNLHPNATGNQTMARQWFQAIEAVVGAQTPSASAATE